MATPRARPPTRAQAEWAGALRVARPVPGEFFLFLPGVRQPERFSTSPRLFGPSACRSLGSSSLLPLNPSALGLLSFSALRPQSALCPQPLIGAG